MGGEGELEAAAEGDGGDCRDCWDLEVGEAGEGAAEVGEELGGSVGTMLANGRRIEMEYIYLYLYALFWCKAASLFQISARAETCINGTGENESSRGAMLVDASSSAKALLGSDFLSVGAVLALDIVNLGAQRGQQVPGDCVSGLRAVELEDADVAVCACGEVRDADEGLGGS